MTAPADTESAPHKTSEAAGSATSSAPSTRLDKAHRIVHKNMYWALGLGLVPVPLLDLAAVTAVQVKMLKELSTVYGVSFSEAKARTIVASLVAGLGGVTIASAIANSLVQVVPVVGQLVGLVGRPVLAGALTVAVGNLFTQHYESGGTLLTFDAAKMREHFRKEFNNGKETARKAHQSDPSDRPPP